MSDKAAVLRRRQLKLMSTLKARCDELALLTPYRKALIAETNRLRRELRKVTKQLEHLAEPASPRTALEEASADVAASPQWLQTIYTRNAELEKRLEGQAEPTSPLNDSKNPGSGVDPE